MYGSNLKYEENSYIIIGGTTRGGSTSLFNYLSLHDQICPSSVKETGFFLDDDYPNPIDTRHHYSDGLEYYDYYYESCLKKVFRLEATPGYLYSKGTARRIHQSLNNVKLIFILRDPIERLVSTYRFNRQTGRISINLTFDDYVKFQMEGDNLGSIRSLKTGKYSHYLGNYFNVFDKDQIRVYNFSLLKNNPKILLKKIYEYIGLSPNLSIGDVPKKYNPSFETKNKIVHKGYLELRKISLKKYTAGNERLERLLKFTSKLFEKTYRWINSENEEEFFIKPDLLRHLQIYYGKERDAIADLINQEKFQW